MMSRAASQAISRNYAELLLWKALTGQLPPRSPSVKCIRSTRAFVAQRRWHWPRVRGLNPTVAAYCENMHSQCILIQFNLDQVSSRRLYEGSCSVESDSRGSGRWDASGNMEKDKKCRQQSNLSVSNVGRGSVKYAIYVFVLPVGLFHKSMLVVFFLLSKHHEAMARKHQPFSCWCSLWSRLQLFAFFIITFDYSWLQKLIVWANESLVSVFGKIFYLAD